MTAASMGGPWRHAAQVGSVLGTVWRNPELRRTQIALAAFHCAEWSVWIAMLLVAYEHGGATASGIVAVVQLVPAALFAPFAATLAERRRPARVLVWGYVAQAAAMGATAAVLLVHGPFVAVVACGAVAATAVTITRPTMAVLVPALARHPADLTAANVVTGANEAVTMLVGPAVTGVVLALAAPGAVFGLMGVLVLLGAVVVAPIRGPRPSSVPGAPAPFWPAGFGAVAREPATRRLVGIVGAEYVTLGMLDVLYVVLALAVLDMGASGAGYLNAAFGLGGAVGIVVTASLVGRRRLMPAVLTGLVVWAAAFAVLAAWPTVGGALLLLAVAGGARSLVDVGSRTLLQRTSPPNVLAGVFGVLEGLQAAALALGSLLAPLVIAVLGGRAAVLTVGLLLPALALTGGRRLLALDASAHVPVVELALLRSLRLFADLPAPELEALARDLRPMSAVPGEAIVTQGEVGDRYYAIADGTLEAIEDGIATRTMGRGDGFGEIALLRDIPRTATVRAITPAHLFALDRAPFVEAVTGHPATRRFAAAITAERLSEAPASS
ncbi:MAG TPA: cyclic nucleotide-binding domain-containing protein [Solirubrobacteraceae bacterium]|nr:cyclic nucleotide-binding domain-containing protein [Solirubrobacteraceae bacterium]